MKKTILFGLFMVIVGLSTAQQVDTFALTNMPKNYYIEEWPDSGAFTSHHTYAIIEGFTIWGLRILNIGVPRCLTIGYDNADIFGYDFWNAPNIKNFAVGKHSDTPISVAGIAFLYPRSKWNYNTFSLDFIRDAWLSHGYDQLKLQLLDTGMNVLAEGTSILTDSIGKPVFQIIGQVNPEVYLGTNYVYQQFGQRGPVIFDIYEAAFPTPVTVTDSFYLALHFEKSQVDSIKEYYSVPVPGIYERMAMNQNADYAYYSDYDFPKIEWLAQGSYRFDSIDEYGTDVYFDTVNDDNWFTFNLCEENHGYMLIFPILETPCHVPTGIRWNPAGGGNVHLRWDSGEWDTEWEVSYGLSGTAPDDGTVVAATTPSVRLSGIGTDTHYVAYVRTKCVVRDTLWSDWSDSISIFISTQGIVEIEGDGESVVCVARCRG